MRDHINLIKNLNKTLLEADVKDKTTNLDFKTATDQGSLSTTNNNNKDNLSKTLPGKQSTTGPKNISFKNADDVSTAANYLQNLDYYNDLEDILSDKEASNMAGQQNNIQQQQTNNIQQINTDSCGVEPKTPENLPAIISKAVTVSGEDINPEWHMVKHLPNYLKSKIRAIGRSVFAPFTKTPIDNIQMISTLSNPERDVRAMMQWISNHGINDDQAELKFNKIMPGYSANVKIYKTLGYTFMLVSDFAGYYIYSWPSSTNAIGNVDRKLIKK